MNQQKPTPENERDQKPQGGTKPDTEDSRSGGEARGGQQPSTDAAQGQTGPMADHHGDTMPQNRDGGTRR